MADHQTTRRELFEQAGKAAATVCATALWPSIVTGKALGDAQTPGASERIRLGFVGLGGQGKNNLKALMGHAVAVCEVDSARLAAAKALVEKANGGTCAAYGDYRKMLEDKSLDGIVVSTPDHWHAKITIDACNAGKDVYCEKPLTLTVAEGQMMVRAARLGNRIVQTGSQQRSDPKFRLACELVRSGRLGKIRAITVGIPDVNFAGPAVPDSDPPPTLDYDFWLGPAPKRPYNAKRVHYLFRFFWDYSGGQQTNFGAHHLDIVQWALGMDESGPLTVQGQARYNADGWFETPEWYEVLYTYPGDIQVKAGMKLKSGITFEGEKGTLSVNRGVLTSDPPELTKEELTGRDVHLMVSDNHHQNWLDCIKSRKLPICDVAIGHRSATVCHLGNIAIRTKQKLTWDAKSERIVGNPDAGAMLKRAWRREEKG